MKKSVLLLCLFMLRIQLSAQDNVVISESNAGFKVKNLGVNVKGQIRGMYGEVRLNQDSSFIRVALDVRAIRTGIRVRDKHLLEERFFHEKQYPIITFESQQITKNEKGYSAIGQLTIKDVTQEIEVPFQGEENEYTGSFSINRKEFNVDNDEFISRGIADMVHISVSIKIDPAL